MATPSGKLGPGLLLLVGTAALAEAHRIVAARLVIGFAINMGVFLTFFLILMMSPGFWHRKAVHRAVVARHQNPTPETVAALRLEQARARRSQYTVCTLAVLNAVAIIVYGASQRRKGTV